jgi:putative inorganic carbon (hco3(-)) transporter
VQNLYRLSPSAIWKTFREGGLSFQLLCFYIFLEYVRPQTIYPAIDVIPWALVTILAAIVAFFLGGHRFQTKSAENNLFVVFFLVILLSSVFAYSPQDSFAKLSIYIAWLLVYFLVINLANRDSRFFVFLLLYLLWNVKMIQHGFLSWAARGFSYSNWGVTGAPGWFQNSGEFGIQLCMVVPLLLSFGVACWDAWGKVLRSMFLLVAAMAFGSTIATNSRGALLGIAGAMLWLVLKSKRRIMALTVIALVAAIGYSVIPEQSLERFEKAGDDYTSYTRLKRWKEGIEIINDHPLLGVGYANWLRYYREHYPPADGPEPWGLPHNIFIDAGSEFGYPGLLLFVAMIIATFVINARTRSQAMRVGDAFSVHIAHGLDAGMVGFLISGSFVSVLWYPYFWISMAFTVALSGVVSARQLA